MEYLDAMEGGFLNFLNAESEVDAEKLQCDSVYSAPCGTRPSDDMSSLRRNYLTSQSALIGEDITMAYANVVVFDNELPSNYGNMLNLESEKPSHDCCDRSVDGKTVNFYSHLSNCGRSLKHEAGVASTDKACSGCYSNCPPIVNCLFCSLPEQTIAKPIPTPPLQKTADGVAIYNKDFVKQLRNRKIADHNGKMSLFKEKEDENGEIVLGMNFSCESLRKLRLLKSQYSQATQKSKRRGVDYYDSMLSIVDHKIRYLGDKSKRVLDKSPGKCVNTTKQCRAQNKFAGTGEFRVILQRCDVTNMQSHLGNVIKQPQNCLGESTKEVALLNKTWKLIGRNGETRKRYPPNLKDQTLVEQVPKLENLLEEEATPSSGETSNCSTIVQECKPIIAECLTDAAPEASTAPPSETEKVATKDSPRKRKITPNTNRSSRDDEDVPSQNCISKLAKLANKRSSRKRTLMELINGRELPQTETEQPVRKSGRTRSAAVSYVPYVDEQEPAEDFTGTRSRYAKTEPKNGSSDPYLFAGGQPTNCSEASGCVSFMMVGGKHRQAMLLPGKNYGCARLQVYTRLSSS